MLGMQWRWQRDLIEPDTSELDKLEMRWQDMGGELMSLDT
jgi:hypothetical protein